MKKLFTSLISVFCFLFLHAQEVDINHNPDWWKGKGYFAEQKTEDEDLSKRGEFTKVFKSPYSNKSKVFIGDWHYKDAQGKWQEINHAVLPSVVSGYSFENTTNKFQTYFGDLLSTGILIKSQNYQLSYKLDSNLKVGNTAIPYSAGQSTSSKTKVAYSGILQSGVFEFETDASSVYHKVHFLNNALFNNHLGNVVYTEYVSIPSGSELCLFDGQRIQNSITTTEDVCIRKNGEVQFTLERARIWDYNFDGNPFESNNTASFLSLSSSYQLINATTLKISTSIPLQWLNDPVRSYPVTLDPIVTIGKGTHTNAYQYPFKTDRQIRTTQYLLRASDLKATGNISEIAYLLTSNNDLPNDNTTVNMQHSSATSITNWVQSNWNNVYSPSTFTGFTTGATSSGNWTPIPLTGFNYNGIDNLLIENFYKNSLTGVGGTFKSGFRNYNCAIRGSCNCATQYIPFPPAGITNYGNQIPYIRLTIGDTLPSLISCDNPIVNVFSRQNTTASVTLGVNNFVEGEKANIKWKAIHKQPLISSVMGFFIDSSVISRQVVVASLNDTSTFFKAIQNVTIPASDTGSSYTLNLRFVNGTNDTTKISGSSPILCEQTIKVFTKQIAIPALQNFRHNTGDTLSFLIQKNIQESVKAWVVNTITNDSFLVNSAVQFDSSSYTSNMGTCRFKWIIPTSFTDGSYLLKARGTISDTVVGTGANFIIGSCLSPHINFDLETSFATEFLCFNELIDSVQDSTKIISGYINQASAAKLLFKSLYYINTNPPAFLPSDSFPVPFSNLQDKNNTNDSFYREIRTLHYLSYKDFEPAWPREQIFFKALDNVSRGLAVRLVMEAYDVRFKTTPPTAVFSDVPTTHPYAPWINYAKKIGLIDSVSPMFQPNSPITNKDFYRLLVRAMTNYKTKQYIPFPSPKVSDFYVPGNYAPSRISFHLSAADGIFSFSPDMPFSISGNGLPLVFSPTYSSAQIDLPLEYYRDLAPASGYNFLPFGNGWSHNYNIRCIKSVGYNSADTRLHFVWSNNSVEVYNPNTNSFETPSTYHTVVVNGSTITLTTKNQTTYFFTNFGSGNCYYIDYISDRFGNKTTFNYIANGTGKLLQYAVDDRKNTRKLEFVRNSITPTQVDNVREIGMGSSQRSVRFTYLQSKLYQYQDVRLNSHTFYYDASQGQCNFLLSKIVYPKGNESNIEYIRNKLSRVRKGDKYVSLQWQPRYTQTNNTNDYTRSVVTHQSGLSATTITDRYGRTLYSSSPTSVSQVSQFDIGKNMMLPKEWTSNGINYSFQYDNSGDVTNTTKRSGNLSQSTNISYTPLHDMDVFTDSRGNAFDYNYTNGGLTNVNLPGGSSFYNITRNATFGRIESIVSADNTGVQIVYNTSGYVEKSYPIGLGVSYATQYLSDDIGRVKIVTDANGKSTSVDYEANDLIKKVTDPASNYLLFEHNDNDDLVKITDVKNQVTDLTIDFDHDDPLGSQFGSSIKDVTYRTDGLPQSFKKGNSTTSFSYDPATLLMTAGMQNTYTYTSDGRFNIATARNLEHNILLAFQYDAFNRITEVTATQLNSGKIHKVGYEYESNSDLISKIYYNGLNSTPYTEYIYNALQQCTQVKFHAANGTTSVEATYEYHNDGRLKREIAGNGVVTEYLYDAGGRLIHQQTKRGNDIVCSNRFDLDNAGMHIKEYFKIPTTDAATPLITYESTAYGPAPYNQTGQYTQNNNNYTMAFDQAGRAYTIGNLSLDYDFNDHLTSVKRNGLLLTTYNYDALGHRRHKTIDSAGATITDIYYNLDLTGMGNVLYEELISNTGTSRFTYYVHGPQGLICRKHGIATEYFHYDYRGSTLATTDQNQVITHGYRYEHDGRLMEEYGQNYDALYPMVFLYVGKWGVQKDVDELYYMRARYLHRATGKFTTEDPVWGKNLYVYADNNTINYTDPLGLFSWKSFGSGVLSGAGKALIGIGIGIAFSVALVAMGVSAPVVATIGMVAAVAGGIYTAVDVGKTAYECSKGGLSDNYCSEYAGEFVGGAVVSFGAANVGSKLFKMPATKTGGQAADFIVSEGGTVFPVPKGATGPIPVTSGKGIQFIEGLGGNGLSAKATGFRFMDPVTTGKYQYPGGYGSYFNKAGQTINPFTGKTISPSDIWWHIPAK